MSLVQQPNARVRSKAVCPHCWHVFAAYDVLYIASHPDLLGDPRLGPEHPPRFLPTRFTPDCAALDVKGMPCRRLACPRCHLEIPRAVIELKPRVVSIIGAPACGKSYFITAQAWSLRKALAAHFRVAFTDADPLMNQRLNDYESLLFLNPDENALVELPKTETFGEFYSSVLFNGQAVHYLKPFLFTLKPAADHPNARGAARLGRLLCLYDNAGESFLPGQDSFARPVTGHLAASDLFMFLFDPTQDVRFRRAISAASPQEQDVAAAIKDRQAAFRQESVLNEAAQRIARSYRFADKRLRPPLAVVVTKFDVWRSLLGDSDLPPAWRWSESVGLAGVETHAVEDVSRRLRTLLLQWTPEVVNTAEDLCDRVIYIPVSATGTAPVFDESRNTWGFRPASLKPIWTEIPLLYYFAKWERGIIGTTRPNRSPVDRPPAVKYSESPPAVSDG
ncbi:MAG: hypothetical protein GYA33_17015 [Thermogutta sp.]|nr:hypothetical protein [Thermogutta sp.]